MKYLVFDAFPLSYETGYAFSRMRRNSFSGLSKVTSISFQHILIQSIASNAFEIYESSDEWLTINLDDCQLSDYVLENDAFTGAKRPVSVFLGEYLV